MQGDIQPHRLDFTSYIQERSRHFAGRVWVLRAIQRWLEAPAPNRRYFLLTGAPGSGKTSVSAQLAGISAGLADPPEGAEALRPGFLSAIHFCRATESRWCDPIAFVASIAAQLQQCHPEFATALAHSLGPNITLNVHMRADTINHGTMTGILLADAQLSADEAFGRFLREPIEALMRARPDFKVTVLVDAMDESRVYVGRRKGIAGLLSRIERLNSNVRFILTSREDAYINSLYPGERLDLSCAEHVDANKADMQRFVDARLDLMSISRAADLGRTLVAMSNFLIVRLALDWIEKEGPGALELGATPQGFDELVTEWLSRMPIVHRKEWRTDYVPILGALLVAQSDLSLAQLGRITGQAESLLRSNVSELSFLLQNSSSGYSIYHQKINEFLECEHIGGDERPGGNQYYIPATEQHARIVRAYKQGAADWRAVDWLKVDDYGLRHLGEHLAFLAGQERDGRLIDEFICHELLVEKRRRFRSDASFVSDVQRSIESAIVQSPPDYHQVIRGCLIIATLTSFADRIPSQALAALAWAGELTLALGWASLRRDPMDYIHIAAALQGQSDRESPRPFLERSRELAREKNDVDALCEIVVLLHDNGDIEASHQTAIEVLAAAENRGSSLESLTFRIARAGARTGEMSPIFEMVARQSNPGFRGLLLAYVAEALRREGKHGEANTVIERAIEEANQDPYALLAWCNIAVALARLGRDKEALTISRRLENGDCTAHVLAEIGPLDAAFARATEQEDARLFSYALDSALRAGMLDRAIAEATLRKPAVATWTAISEAASQRGRWKEAVAAIEKISNGMSRLDAWKPLAQALSVAHAASFSAGVAVLENASKRSDWQSEREMILGILACGFARHAQPERAIGLASQCINLSRIRVHRSQMVRTLAAIAECFADHGQRDSAAAVADEVDRIVNLDGGWRSTPAEMKSTQSTIRRLRRKLARPPLRAKKIDPTQAQDHPESSAVIRLEDIERLVAGDEIFHLQAIGAAAARNLGAEAVIAAISGIAREFDRARTLEIITEGLSANGAWREALQFSLARLRFESETMGRHRTFQHLERDIPIYWALDDGRTLKKIYHVIRELESWWD